MFEPDRDLGRDSERPNEPALFEKGGETGI